MKRLSLTLLVSALAVGAYASGLGLVFRLETSSALEPGEGAYAHIHVSIPYDEMLFIKTDSSYRASYRIFYRIMTDDGDKVHSDHLYGRVEVFSYEETNSRELQVREEMKLKLPAGKYMLKVTVEDEESQRRGVRESEIDFRLTSSGGFQLSSLELYGCDGERNTLADTLPSPCTIVTVGAEFYCLKDDPPPSVAGLLRLLTDKDDLMQERPDTLALTGEVTKISFPLSLSGLPPGGYKLELEIPEHDLFQSTEFVIPWSILAMVNEPDDVQLFLNYIADRNDVREFKKLESDERVPYWLEFWKRRDPVPSTERNELMEQYERRIMYANEKFGAFEDGWKTDMGMIHVMFGRPDDIERHPFDLDSKPYEIWTYYSLNRRFVFVDRTGFGRYDLVSGDYSRR
jgi:GWxTD domain-containing protein